MSLSVSQQVVRMASSSFVPNRWRSIMRKAGAIFGCDAALTLSYDFSFWTSWIGIAVQVLSFYFISKLMGSSPKFGYGGHPARYFDFIVVNLAFVRFQATAIQCFQNAVRNDQLAGTLEAIIATPTSLPVIILSRGLWAFTLTFMQVVLFMVLAVLLGLSLAHVNVLSVIVFTILTIACMSPLGVMSAASIMTFKQTGGTGFVMGGLTQLLGGVLFPVSTLPAMLQYVSWALPITHALDGIRGAVHGATLAQLAPEVIWLSIAAAILLPLSLWSFGRAVERAKMDGTLGHY
jgi:ABC-2 type transport system permease protein